MSCLFQALWHSVVFHAAFEKDLEEYTPAQDEALLAALQETWKEYKAEKSGSKEVEKTEAAPAANALVPADGLVGGFGEGYGDMSEALACLQSELADSTNLAAIALSERIVLLPLVASDGLPGPELAWKQAQEWQVCNAALIAVDINVPELGREDLKKLAQLWVPVERSVQEYVPVLSEAGQIPKADSVKQAAESDGLGRSHQLVALVCYMWHLQHYVAFCRRQSNSVRCCFFNDLPELTSGVPKEVEWQRVPEVCAEYSLTPRLAFYETTETTTAPGPM